MIADHGTKEAEKELEKLADDLQRTYSEAQKDLQKKLESYTKKFEKEDAKRRELRDQGKITGRDYANWKMGQVFIGKQWQSKLDQMTQSLAHTNELALSIIRDGQMDVFAENANYFDYRIENDTGIAVSWGLYDEQTVISLIKDQPELMPRKNLDKGKDEAWNRTIIANCVTQSIIQGESINQLAKRVARDTASTNMKAMVRYARTAMTAAQNSGRIQAMNNAKDKGINVKKVWIATMDERTRHAHEQLDGQTQDVNEPFDSELGAIMYPGDPSADEANVWNCRCALGYEYPDYPSSYDYEEESGDDEEAYEEWEEHKEEQKEPEKIFGFRAIGREHGIDDDLPMVNPNYLTEDRLYTQNCGNCTLAYDMRRRGVDVEASGRDGMYVSDWKKGWIRFNPKPVKAARKQKALEEIRETMIAWGEGARASIFGVWDGRKCGHYFNAEVKDGTVRFVDGQPSGKEKQSDASGYFERMKPSSIMYGRTDNLELNESVLANRVKERDKE